MENETQKVASKILNNAADLLEKYGWIQDDYGNHSCGFCASGAILAASILTSNILDLYKARELLSNVVIKQGYSSIVDWNDAPNASKEQVIAKLREAAQQTQTSGA
jgi:hypothetical protein